MTYRLVRELATDADLQVDVTVACRLLKASRSGYYECLGRARSTPPGRRRAAERHDRRGAPGLRRHLRGAAGARRAPVGPAAGLRAQAVARLMRTAGLAGAWHRRKHRRAGPAPAVHADLVQRRFVTQAPDRLWVTDITEYPTAELVVDALKMARCCRRRHPGPWSGATGGQHTSWIFGHRLRAAGLLGPMGRSPPASTTA